MSKIRGDKMGTIDKASIKAQELKGKAKEAAGKVTGDKRVEREGKVDQAKSAVKGVGEKAKDAASKVKSSIKR
jgi:uncharacterized protein YjbJ (UPF0337 family)